MPFRVEDKISVSVMHKIFLYTKKHTEHYAT